MNFEFGMKLFSFDGKSIMFGIIFVLDEKELLCFDDSVSVKVVVEDDDVFFICGFYMVSLCMGLDVVVCIYCI